MEDFEKEKQQLQEFGDWMEKYSGQKSKATIMDTYKGVECTMPVLYGAPLKMVDGVPVPTSGVAKTPFAILWKIFQEQKAQSRGF